jgi:DNA-binding LacI/PurR family transcriptional regulator
MPARPTLKDVAALAGVSYQTVSKVLNGTYAVPPETEARIRAAVDRLGYVPSQQARNLRSRRSWMIGYSWVATDPATTPSPVMDEFLTAMVEEAEEAGFYLLPFTRRTTADQVADYRRLIETDRVDGFVLSSIDYGDPRIEYLLRERVPFVAFGRADAGQDVPSVDVDGAAGSGLAVDHLAGLGHRRLAIVGLPVGSRVGDERLAGFREAAGRHGIEVPDRLVARGPDTAESGRELAAVMLRGDPAARPSAIVAMSDTLAVGVLDAARAAGLEPGRDLAVTGFDDSPVARYLRPALTTLHQPLHEAGRRCIRMLAALIEGHEPDEREVRLAPTLVVRETTVPGPSAGVRPRRSRG